MDVKGTPGGHLLNSPGFLVSNLEGGRRKGCFTLKCVRGEPCGHRVFLDGLMVESNPNFSEGGQYEPSELHGSVFLNLKVDHASGYHCVVAIGTNGPGSTAACPEAPVSVQNPAALMDRKCAEGGGQSGFILPPSDPAYDISRGPQR